MEIFISTVLVYSNCSKYIEIYLNFGMLKKKEPT